MTARLFCAAAVAVVFAGGVSAQQNPSSAPDRAQLVLTGCMEHADDVKAPNTSDTTVDSLTFILTRAVPATSSATAAATAAVGTTGTAPRSYRLDAMVEKLGVHVGQHVQITGTLAEPPTEPAGAGSTANMPRVMVDSIKVIDATCPR